MRDIDNNRRTVLQTLIMGALGTTPIAAISMAPDGPGTTPSPDPHRLLLSLRYGARDMTTYWWISGCRYAAIDNEMIPLFNLWVGFAYRRSRLDARVDQVQIRSRVLYTALDSDELLTRWLNPISGQSVEFSWPDPVTETYRFDFKKGLQRSNKTPTQQREDRITAVRRTADRIFLDEEARVQIFESPERDKPARRVYDRYTWSGPSAIESDPIGQFLPGEVSFMDVTDWSPRLRMGSIRGSAVAHCSGSKSESLAHFPTIWHRLHERNRLAPLSFSDRVAQ